jgi:hypothetical protein
METKDSLFFSREEESSNKFVHVSRDSLDEDLDKLSLAISRKHLELTQNRNGDSHHFTLDDIVEDDMKDLEIEQLKMRVEDLESFICEKLGQNQEMTYIAKKEGFNLFQKTSFLDFSNSLDVNLASFVECSLIDLYQLVDDASRIIRLAEADLKMLGRLTLGNFKLDVRVNKDDFLMAEKEEVSQQLIQFDSYPEKSRLFEEVFADNPIFYMFEGRMNEEYEKVKFFNYVVEIGKNDLKTFDGCRSSIINFLEFKLLQKTKEEEKSKIRELDWQTTQARSKKSSFFHKSKKVSSKEEELRKLNRNISQQTVKNAKDREKLEEDIEDFTKQKDEFLLKTTEKVEVIRKVLQEIEDAKIEEKEEPINNKSIKSIRPYDAPSVINEVPLDHQIKSLHEELLRLEYEYKTSTIPETLETISTNIDRVKSNLMNLQSLKVLKSTERNSSAIRNRIKMAEKNFESTSDHTSSFKDDGHKPRNLPHPFRNQNITLSPVRRLEVNTTRLDTSTLNSPSRRSPFLQKVETKEDIELKKYLRKKEQELNEREEEIENEEKKIFELWSHVQDNQEIVEIMEKELADIRKAKKEIISKNSLIDREKIEITQRVKRLEAREKECQGYAEKIRNSENEFERKKDSIYEKLEWLKRKLLRFD